MLNHGGNNDKLLFQGSLSVTKFLKNNLHLLVKTSVHVQNLILDYKPAFI